MGLSMLKKTAAPSKYLLPPRGFHAPSDGPRTLAYAVVEEALRDGIERREYKPGDLVPSESQLAETFQVSVGTVKKAIQNLVAAGFLYRIQGKGTYVAGNFVRSEKLRFYRTLSDFFQPEPPYSLHFVSIEHIPPLLEANASLHIDKNAPLIRLVRMMCMDDKPFVIIHSHFEEARFPGLLDLQPKDFEKRALTVIMENDYETPTLTTQELISAMAADATLARNLCLPEGSPILCLEMLSFTYRDNPYEFRRAYCSPGRKIFRKY